MQPNSCPVLTAEQKVAVFKRELSYIKDLEIRTLTEDLIGTIPNYFFEIPASSTGKYHPDYALGKGGLVRHTKAACLFANILRIPNPLQLSERMLDCAIAALIMHDTRKSGISDEAKSQYTRFDHPILAANAVKTHVNFDKNVLSVDDMAKCIQFILDTIARGIESHMGQWNTSSYAPGVVLPVPSDPLQHFVHMCDYLASRKELDIKNLF